MYVYLQVVDAKLSKMSQENEELRAKKRDLESSLKSLQSDFDQMNHQHEDLSIKVVEKERQVSELWTFKVSSTVDTQHVF